MNHGTDFGTVFGSTIYTCDKYAAGVTCIQRVGRISET
jgi:hypothetical protein